MGKAKKDIIKTVKTRMGTYEVLFESNAPGKGYTVTVPTLPGIVTFGDTMIEATKNAIEATELHCEGLLEDGLARVSLISKY